MPETLIKVDLKQSPYENEMVHNRWHPDIPMACWVKPGDDFVLETYDWTGGAIKNDDDASDVRDVDLSTVHCKRPPLPRLLRLYSLLLSDRQQSIDAAIRPSR